MKPSSLAGVSQPDILILDLEMPGMDGVQVIRQVKADYPHMQAIVFTAFDTDERILGAVKAGAVGYLLKGAPRDELFRAIRLARQGRFAAPAGCGLSPDASCGQ